MFKTARTQSLCGDDWELIYVQNEKLNLDGFTEDIEALKQKGYGKVAAHVPGNLEIDLQRAGIIEDPFFADNHHKRCCEYYHSFYTRKFFFNNDLENPVLVFEGIDTFADVYLNGALIGSTDNMLIEHEFDVKDMLVVGQNTLTVHIKPAVIEARKHQMTLNDFAFRYNCESLYMRKAPHMFGWDILPRVVSAGIWKPVYLAERKKERIVEFFCYTSSINCDDNTAQLYFLCNTVLNSDESLNYSLHVEGSCGDSQFLYQTSMYHTDVTGNILLQAPKLWWPIFNGNQDLYDVKVTLLKNDKVIDEYNTRLGVRTVSLDRTSVTDKDGNGEFCFRVNGVRIFCMGTNWVPADALHSRDAERTLKILTLVSDVNCNILRVWGGGVYESDEFYDYCDEHGILVWQDFVMACGSYPQDFSFGKRIFDEAVAVIKRLRQHPSLLVWAGDNENDLVWLEGWGKRGSRNPNDNLLTRQIIPHALHLHDFTRPYIPSSPYIDSFAYAQKNPILTEQHLWGPRDYFKSVFYKESTCHFVSETGYHACCSPSSIKKFIPKEFVWTAKNCENWDGIDNNMWIAHACAMECKRDALYTFRIRLMANQVTTLFGNTVPYTLEDFCKASQISQAEADKYYIERFRVSKWRRTGILWWNIMDGWPQFSDAVVDYYFVKKLAYHYIKRSQNPVCMIFDEPVNNKLLLYAVNEFHTDMPLSYTVKDMTSNKTVSQGEAVAKAAASTLACKLPVENGEKHFYFIEWTLNGQKYSNHYMTNIIDIDYKEYMGYIEKCGYAQFEGF